MFKSEYESAANAALSKRNFLFNNPVGYFALSVAAGMYIGFGVLLAFTIGGYLDGAPITKFVSGSVFVVALSLVVMAGAELFTGNVFVMFTGITQKKVTVADTIKLWLVCYIGNLCGSILLAAIYKITGLGSGDLGLYMAAAALAKMTASAPALFTRGILCNILVCLAVWCGFRCKSETAKLIMIFWCVLAFFASGFEHSIANMTLLSYVLMNPMANPVSILGMCYNLFFVTLGNIVGGIVFVGLPYMIAARES